MSKLNLEIDKEIISIFEQRYQSIIRFEDSIDRFQDELDQFEKKIKEQKDINEFFDESQARYLFNLGKQTLQYCQDNLGHNTIPYLLAAVAYLVKEDDAQDDFATVDGLDDDQALLESVIDAFKIKSLISYITEEKGA